VLFGSTPVSSFTLVSNTSITTASPVGTAGSTVDVTVVTYGKIDLLTVLTHELGHIAGYVSVMTPNELMTTTLAPDVRRVPAATAWSPGPGPAAATDFAPAQDLVFAGLQVLGTAPAERITSDWLADNRPAIHVADDGAAASVAAPAGYQLPARTSWLDPQPPTILEQGDSLGTATLPAQASFCRLRIRDPTRMRYWWAATATTW
jgi:hypothetical protein